MVHRTPFSQPGDHDVRQEGHLLTEPTSREQIYAKTREDLLKRQLSNNENFDRSILTLSSAALALTVAFIRGISAINSISLLILSWVALVCAILSTILSYLASQRGIARQLELAERYYLKNDEDALNERNFPAILNEILGYLSAISFVAGIILLLVFFGINAKP